MLQSSSDNFIAINNIELGEGDELINSPTDIAKVGRCAKTFVEDCKSHNSAYYLCIQELGVATSYPPGIGRQENISPQGCINSICVHCFTFALKVPLETLE